MSTLEELLSKLDLSKYAEKFRAEEIDLAMARKLSEDELKDLGLPLGARKKLHEALQSTTAAAAGPVSPAASGSAPASSATKFVAADPAVGQHDTRVPLEGRKSIRDNAKNFDEFTARLKKALGAEYYFSFDYGAIVAALNEALKVPKPPNDMLVSDDYPKRIGEILHCAKGSTSSYLAEIVENLERFAGDAMNREAFRVKTPARAIALQSGTVTSAEDPYKAHKQSFTDGALLIIYNPIRFWTNIERIARPSDLEQML